MKGKTLLLLALALSMALVYAAPLVNASPTSMEIIFDDTGTSTYNPCPLPVGAKFDVTLHVTNVPADPGCVQWMAKISWDPAILNITKKPTQGPWLSQDGALATGFLVKPINYTEGKIPEMTCGLMEAGTTSGSGILAIMTFKALAVGQCDIAIYGSKLYNSTGANQTYTVSYGHVTVVPEFPAPLITAFFLIITAVIVILVKTVKPTIRREHVNAP